MATEAQILANRRNAQKSTGPRTLSMSLGAPGDLFMQNKANFHKAQMNEDLFAAKDYENETAFRLRENKPNQTQFQKGRLCRSPGRCSVLWTPYGGQACVYRIAGSVAGTATAQ